MPIDPLDHSVTEALRGWLVQHSAGVGLADTLTICATVCAEARAKEAFLEAARRAQAGEEIERLLEALAGVFSEGERAVLAAGWNSGRAEAAMEAVLAQRELWYATSQRIRARLALPLLILVMASFVAPLPRFIQTGAALEYLFSALSPLFVAFVIWRLCAALMRARARESLAGLDRLLLSLPLAGAIERQRSLGEIATLLSNLVGAGVVLSRALEICARAARNSEYRAELLRCAAHARQAPLSEALKDRPLWPFEFAAAVEVGEKSGKLDEVLARLGRQARERYAAAVEALAEWLPRFIYALIVIFMIVQILMLASGIGSLYGSFM